MDHIIVVGLTLLYGFSQIKTDTLIMRWPEMNTYFHSMINIPYSPGVNSYEIQNNLFSSDEELCGAVGKSTIFDIDKEVDEEEHSNAQSSSSSDFNEERLNLIFQELSFDDAENDFIRKERKVKYDNGEVQLSTFPCPILPGKIVYLSEFYKGRIILYFIFAKTKESDIPQLFAAIGKYETFTLAYKKTPSYYSHTWYENDITVRKRIEGKVLRMTPTQCAWLCAIIEGLRFHRSFRKYVNLFILVENNSIITISTISANEVLHNNVPILRYKVLHSKVAESNKIRIIAPGLDYPFQQRSAFFYGNYTITGIVINKLFLITSPYV